MVRRCVLAAGLLLLLGGCGGDGGGATASRTPVATATPAAAKAEGPTGSKAPVLVEMTMQRPGALLDKITIHTDGYGLFDRPSGGVGRVQRDVVVDRRCSSGCAGTWRSPGDGGEPAAARPRTSRPTSCATTAARWSRARAPSPQALREPDAAARRAAGRRRHRARSCASASAASPARRTSRGVGKAKKAPELVFFQRQGAGGATLDTFTVRRDGTAPLEKRYGGAGGRFKELELREGVLPRLGRRWRAARGLD